MIWTKLGILLIGFTYAGLLPYSVRKVLDYISFDLKNQTLSFLSNKDLYSEKLTKGYRLLLFITALLTYAFFWLLSVYYDLGEYERLMRYIDLGFASLVMLAFVPHNIMPYSLRNLTPNLQRLMHNLLAIIVFLSLPALIITFQMAILPEINFLGISGMVIICFTVVSVAFSMIKNGVNGASELLFINGISLWTIFVTIVTFLS